MTLHTTTVPRPSWEETWAAIGSEDMLAAKALIELSPSLRAEAGTWLAYEELPVCAIHGDGHTLRIYPDQGDPLFCWEAWLADVDEHGRGWSSTEGRLFQVVAAVLDPDREVNLRQTLGYGMGSWELDVWRILADWGTGGNNRDRAGRVTVAAR